MKGSCRHGAALFPGVVFLQGVGFTVPLARIGTHPSATTWDAHVVTESSAVPSRDVTPLHSCSAHKQSVDSTVGICCFSFWPGHMGPCTKPQRAEAALNVFEPAAKVVSWISSSRGRSRSHVGSQLVLCLGSAQRQEGSMHPPVPISAITAFPIPNGPSTLEIRVMTVATEPQ